MILAGFNLHFLKEDGCHLCLLAIGISSSVTCPKTFAHSLIEMFVILLLSFETSLYILDTSPLSYIVSQPVACLFVLLRVSSAEQKFSQCSWKFVFKRSLNFWLFKISSFFPKIGRFGS